MTLTVCDVAGREVANLLENRPLEAGEHGVWFRGRDLPAGIYLCTLRGEGFSETGKMVRVR